MPSAELRSPLSRPCPGCRGGQQAKILHMMDDNKQLALRIDGALQAAGQEVTALRAELAATGRRLAELGSDPAMEHGPHGAQAYLRSQEIISEPRGTATMEPPKRREMERLEQETKGARTLFCTGAGLIVAGCFLGSSWDHCLPGRARGHGAASS